MFLQLMERLEIIEPGDQRGGMPIPSATSTPGEQLTKDEIKKQ